LNLQLIHLPPKTEPEPIREAEFLFALSLRHALPFSVVALVAHRLDGAESGAHGPSSEAAIETDERWIERRLAPMFRRTDVLVRCTGPGRYMAFCLGNDEDGIGRLARRLEEELDGLQVATGIACFGGDALTLGDLVDHAWSKVPIARDPNRDDDDQSPGRGLDRIDHGRGRRRASGFRRRLSTRIKRLFDLALIGITAPFWLPTFVLVAIAVKLSDPAAPLFFVQMRTGQGGRRFRMYKFRTMVANAEALKEQLRTHSELAWPDFKIKRDPRITPLGRWLRKSSLDELPQLINVILGDMSLVGPRPTSFEPDTYEPWQTARLDAQPGLTGLWQVEGRAETRFDERIRIELDYIERQGFWLDLWILLRTVPAVLKMRGGH